MLVLIGGGSWYVNLKYQQLNCRSVRRPGPGPAPKDGCRAGKDNVMESRCRSFSANPKLDIRQQGLPTQLNRTHRRLTVHRIMQGTPDSGLPFHRGTNRIPFLPLKGGCQLDSGWVTG